MTAEIVRLVKLINQKGYKNLIFDLDETLIELDMPWDIWIKDMASKLPPRQDEKFIQAAYHPDHPCFEILNEQIKIDLSFSKIVTKSLVDFEQKHLHYIPYLELIDAIPALSKNGRKLYIWSNNSKFGVNKPLEQLGVLQYFSKIITTEDVSFKKPDLEGWQLLKNGDPLKSFLLIGDSHNDKFSAETIGINYFAIKYFKD